MDTKRNLAPFTRVELALKLEPLLRQKAKESYNANVGRPSKSLQKSATISKSDTRSDLARVAGVSHDTITKGKLVAEHADEATKKRLRENQISVHRVAKDIKEKIQRERRSKTRLSAAATVEVHGAHPV